MSTAMACTDCAAISFYPSIGFGSDSQILQGFYTEIVSDFRNTETLGRGIAEALEKLTEVFAACAEEGWDGYDAHPITIEVFFEAKRAIERLPLASHIPPPEIVPEPTGEIGLEWYRDRRLVFVASVTGHNEIFYAGLFGPNKVHGTEYFGDVLPSVIMENLRRLYPRS